MFHIRLALILLLLAACSQSEPPGALTEQTKAVPFKPTGDVKHLMQWVLDPATDKVWDSAGFIITTEGTADLQPTTKEGWLAVQHSAAVVAESGNLLMMPGLARDDGAWRDMSLGLIEAGLRAKAAADAHDADALFEAGGQIYRVCKSCHSVYMQDDEVSEAP